MTSSPPDISSLTLAPQRTRPTHDTYDQSSAPQAYHFQTSPAVVPSPGQRRALPSAWLSENESNANIPPDARSMSPPQASDISSGGGSPPSSQAQTLAGAAAGGSVNDDDIIPTAIVIKNIPFNVKRETLLDIIASLSIPTPYAFNYHLDPAGQFRGLAFANFRVAADADAVVAALNGFDVQGRKLRVEYKKVLQAGEKERIEREKALRRMRSMQMEKEAQAAQQGQQVQQPMMPSMSGNMGSGYDEGYSPLSGPPMLSASRSFQGIQNANPFALPMPVPQPYMHPGQSPSQQTPPSLVSSQSGTSVHKAAPQTELDLNDPATLEIYSRILLFKDDHMRDELAFARSLSPKQRRIVHLVAQKLGVYHYSVGEADERYAVVTRREPDSRSIQENGRQTPIGSNGNINSGSERIGLPRHHSSNALNRSFLASSGAGTGGSMFSTSTSSYSAASSGLSNGNGSPSSPIGGGLRSKKSMPDMKSLYTPQPRLTPRSSNGNMREGISGYAALRRQTSGVLPGLNQIFGSQLTGGGSSSLSRASVSGAIGQRGIAGFQALDGTTEEDSVPGSAIPPVPMLPEGAVNVVRQPRGPGAGGGGGFGARRQSTIGPMDRGLDSRTHEPLEI